MIKSHLTAMSRSTASAPLKELLTRGLVRGDILDYGCGRGYDSRYLRAIGHTVFQYDPYYAPGNVPLDAFDTAICLYVLNVIPERRDRLEVVGRVLASLRSGGTAYFAARTITDIESSVKDSWVRYGDGYITPRQTFQAGLTMGKLADLAISSGARRVDSIQRSSGYVMVGASGWD